MSKRKTFNLSEPKVKQELDKIFDDLGIPLKSELEGVGVRYGWAAVNSAEDCDIVGLEVKFHVPDHQEGGDE